jgi:hypothetical protein
MNPGRVLGPCPARGLGWRQGRREMQAGVAGDRSVLAHDWDARGQLGHGNLVVGLHPRGLPGATVADWLEPGLVGKYSSPEKAEPPIQNPAFTYDSLRLA